MTLEEFLEKKINSGEDLSELEIVTYNRIKEIKRKYKEACDFIKANKDDMAQYDGNTQQDNEMVNSWSQSCSIKLALEGHYPEIVLKKDLTEDIKKRK